MIYESATWKKELYNSYLTIAKYRFIKRKSEQSQIKVEKALMIGAYVIRKLEESKKIPPKMMLTIESLEYYERKDTYLDFLNMYDFEKHYNFDKIVSIEKDWKFIINQIIHSYVFFFSYNHKDQLNGFYFNSDKTKNHKLFFVSVEMILYLFLSVSEGDITQISLRRRFDKVDNILLVPQIENVVYSYSIDLKQIVSDTLKGNFYERKKID